MTNVDFESSTLPAAPHTPEVFFNKSPVVISAGAQPIVTHTTPAVMPAQAGIHHFAARRRDSRE